MSAIGLQCNPSAPDPSPGLYDNPLSVMVALEDAGFPVYAADAMAYLLHVGDSPRALAEMWASIKPALEQIVSEYERDRRAA